MSDPSTCIQNLPVAFLVAFGPFHSIVFLFRLWCISWSLSSFKSSSRKWLCTHRYRIAFTLCIFFKLNEITYIMAKRKRNRHAAPADDQHAVTSPSKKLKVADDASRTVGPKQKSTSGKPVIASPDSKRKAVSTSATPAAPEPAAASGSSKTSSSLKRERKRKRLREAKKIAVSGDKAGDEKPPTLSEQKSLPQELPNVSVPNPPQLPAVVSDKKGGKDKIRKSEKSVSVDSSQKPSDTKIGSQPSKVVTSKKQHDDPANKKATTGRPGDSATNKPETEQGGLSKKKLRRQRAFEAKQAATPSDSHPQVKSSDNVNVKTPSKAKSSPSTTDAAKSTTSSGPSLLQQTTKTHLLPRPIKQWVEQEDMEQVDSTITNHAHTGGAADDSILDPLQSALRGTPEKSSSPKNSTGSVDGIPDPLAAIGVPASNQVQTTAATPLARPGINTIASFSLSSRRHPASVLAKQRTMSGLRGMRMDTGMIGASPKPPSANKANSVPSYSGSGDVKAAFNRFNKFAHGGNSSDSDHDSEESEDNSDADDAPTSKSVVVRPVAQDAKDVHATPSKTTTKVTVSVPVVRNGKDDSQGDRMENEHMEIEAPSFGPAQANSTVRTNDPTEDHVSNSADSSESEDEASGVAPTQQANPTEPFDVPTTSDHDADVLDTGNELLAQPPNNAPRMLGEKDLPLFSDFNAKHNITPADIGIERSVNFLERELGGDRSGFGQTDDQDASTHSFIDYVASQDADDLYKSIEDISREVFGSTREIPDCKPLSKSNYLDVASEPFVTDFISNHGLGRKSAELETSQEKSTVLSNIVRESPPAVYIANEMNICDSTALDNGGEGDDKQEELDEEELDADSGLLFATQQPNLDQYSSPSSSISSLTPSPTPPDVKPQATPADTSQDETNVDNTNLERLPKVSSPIHATEGKKRKLTGTTSKHFSPKKSLPRAASARVKSESKYIDDVSSHDTDDEFEQPESSNEVVEESQSRKTSKRKGTGKTSVFFTPTSSPSKPTDTKKATPKTPRPPKGTSTCPVPSTNCAHFGLIQEKLWKEPFWLIIAVTFLNKTAGRAAAPIFWDLKELYPTPEALSQAREKDLVSMIGTLGLQNQRAKRLVLIAKTWLESPPAKNQRYRTLHYPAKGDGKDIKKDQVIDEDADACEGALEIGHIPGCGPYAWDSWRIFCRDVQRGLAQDFNGRCAGKDFEPEWQRVVPLDKELRACLRWMWLREGWVWNHETGERRDATLQEMEAGLKGEMEIADEQERKFAAEAAGVTGDGVGRAGTGTVVKDEGGDDKKESVEEAATSKKAASARSRKMSIARRELDVESGDEAAITTLRRSRRTRAG